MESNAPSVVIMSAVKCIVPTPNPTWLPVSFSMIFQRNGVPDSFLLRLGCVGQLYFGLLLADVVGAAGHAPRRCACLGAK